ncbi:hypothetical protein ACFQ3Z_16210 [Streptomyces nogalater]
MTMPHWSGCALAAEARPDESGTEAQPPRYRWTVETHDDVADEWAPGTWHLVRCLAVERYEALNQSHPVRRDGTPAERRLVRETTTYTIEEPTASTGV